MREIKKGSKIQVQGQRVTVDSVDSTKFGPVVYYRLNGEYCWSYLAEITSGL